MSGRVEHFAFNIGDKVMVKEIQRPGRIDALLVDCLGPQYQVLLWDNGERKRTWLYPDEIEAR